jgi:pectinesterase
MTPMQTTSPNPASGFSTSHLTPPNFPSSPKFHRPPFRPFLVRCFSSIKFQIFTITLLLSAHADTNLFVSPDGSAQFKSVQEAINATPQNAGPSNQVFIHIKPGIYKEAIYVQREKRFVHLVGEDTAKTILTGDLYASMPGPDGQIIGTFRTASTFIDADDFSAENITFENSAGPKGQALAIRVDGDRVAFRQCRFLGWQDTILDNRGRHYYADCYIAGVTDFIFGGGTSFFEECHIHCLSRGYITAASTPAEEPFGFVFLNCTITGADGVQSYLGRPWRDYAATAFLHTQMSGIIRPEGWDNWKLPAREKTARYAEFSNAGPGAETAGRVSWSRQITPDEAASYTVENVLGGPDHWKPRDIAR